jgi:hypothetical protein
VRDRRFCEPRRRRLVGSPSGRARTVLEQGETAGEHWGEVVSPASQDVPAVELTAGSEDHCAVLSRVWSPVERYGDYSRASRDGEELGRVGESRSRKFSKFCSRTKGRLQTGLRSIARGGRRREELERRRQRPVSTRCIWATVGTSKQVRYLQASTNYPPTLQSHSHLPHPRHHTTISRQQHVSVEIIEGDGRESSPAAVVLVVHFDQLDLLLLAHRH